MASPFLVFLLGISLQVVTCMSREIFYKIVPVDESEIAEALNELEPDYNWRNNGLYKTLILGNFFFF